MSPRPRQHIPPRDAPLERGENGPGHALTATPCADATSARHGQGIIVNWMFQAGTLTLALNPTAAIDIPCLIQGAPVYTGDFQQHGEILRLGA